MRRSTAVAVALVLVGTAGVTGCRLDPRDVLLDYVGAVAWGENRSGQLGDGTQLSHIALTPVQDMASNVIRVSAGASHSLAVSRDGFVWAWGDNSYGQLGNGTTTPSLVPVRVPGLEGVLNVSAGAMHSLAYRSDGSVWAWGWNQFGQLGDGTFEDRHAPVQVIGLSNTVLQIAAGDRHSLAATFNREVFAWGDNNNGQLGKSAPAPIAQPRRVDYLPAKSYEIAAGGSNSMALGLEGNELFAWGDNHFGQIGDGTTITRYTAVRVPIPEDVIIRSFAVSGGHTVMADANGRVFTWGYNINGQLGQSPDQVPHPTPAQVSFTNGSVTEVAAGDWHTTVLTSAKTVFTWGCLDGEGPRPTCSVQARSVPGAVDVQFIEAGNEHDVATKYTPPVLEQ